MEVPLTSPNGTTLGFQIQGKTSSTPFTLWILQNLIHCLIMEWNLWFILRKARNTMERHGIEQEKISLTILHALRQRRGRQKIIRIFKSIPLAFYFKMPLKTFLRVNSQEVFSKSNNQLFTHYHSRFRSSTKMMKYISHTASPILIAIAKDI